MTKARSTSRSNRSDSSSAAPASATPVPDAPAPIEEEAAAIDPRDPDAPEQVEALVREANHGGDPGVALEEAGQQAADHVAESAMCDVEFHFPGEASQVVVAGDFNAWSTNAHPMQRTDDGFRLTVPLERGRRYRYRFVVDERWTDDPSATDFEWNDHGDRNAVVST